MLSSIKQRMDRDEDEGFTLIELMVVLLIIAILLAIAIPTFLGARNTANARSTQENLRNALTAEQTNWTNTQSFAADLSSVESSLDWLSTAPTQEGGNAVEAIPYNWNGGAPTAVTSGSSDSVLILGYAKDGNCYAIFQSDNATTSFTAYHQSTGACSSSNPAVPTAAPTSGTSAATNTGSSASDGGWSASF